MEMKGEKRQKLMTAQKMNADDDGSTAVTAIHNMPHYFTHKAPYFRM